MEQRKEGEELGVRCLTFNLACNPPPPLGEVQATLLPLLDVHEGGGGRNPDLIAVGFQEVHSRLDKYFLDALVSGEDEWTAAVTDCLLPRGYKRVRSIRLLGIVLSLFCRREHLLHLRKVETRYLRLSLGGYLGFKGAVSVRLRAFGVSLCLVNAHLSAHDENLEDRIAEYGAVVDALRFGSQGDESVFDHDYLLWMGDLNFRLSCDGDQPPLDFSRIRSSVRSGDLRGLLGRDQLALARKEERAFHQLEEGEIGFAPTYKFVVGTGEYDPKRRPAWTDRVLYRTRRPPQPEGDSFSPSLSLTSYVGHGGVSVSDHRPVTASLVASRRTEEEEGEPGGVPFGAAVEFLAPQGWSGGGGECVARYRVADGCEGYLKSWDWIGLFKSNFRSLEDYLTFTWSFSSSSSYFGRGGGSVREEDGMRRASFLNVGVAEAGEFVLVYFGQDNCVLGISAPFHISGPSADY